MALCYKPLLLLAMCDHCDTEGRASIRTLAEYFSGVFHNRRNNGKVEENPNRFPAGNLPSDRSLSQWEYESSTGTFTENQHGPSSGGRFCLCLNPCDPCKSAIAFPPYLPPCPSCPPW